MAVQPQSVPQPASLAAVLAGRPLLWHAVAFAVGVAAGLRTVGDPPPWLAAAGGLSLLCLLLRCHGRAALLGGLGVAHSNT